MGLTQSQKAMIEKARSAGNSTEAVPLTDDICVYLVAVIAEDLGLKNIFPELPKEITPFFTGDDLDSLRIPDIEFMPLLERLVEASRDADTFFVCLANLPC